MIRVPSLANDARVHPHSSTRNDYIFEKPVSPSNISTTFETLKQDQLELRLYQVRARTLRASRRPARKNPFPPLIRRLATLARG